MGKKSCFCFLLKPRACINLQACTSVFTFEMFSSQAPPCHVIGWFISSEAEPCEPHQSTANASRDLDLRKLLLSSLRSLCRLLNPSPLPALKQARCARSALISSKCPIVLNCRSSNCFREAGEMAFWSWNLPLKGVWILLTD